VARSRVGGGPAGGAASVAGCSLFGEGLLTPPQLPTEGLPGEHRSRGFETFGRHPSARLEAEAGQHVGAVLLARRAVLVAAGPIEQAVVDDQVPRRADQPDAVARGVDHAPVDQRVLPVAARDAVVPL